MSRTEKGTFAPKFEEKKKLRTIRLTDNTWKKLQERANELSVTRTDVIESMEWNVNRTILAEINRFIETESDSRGLNQHKKDFSIETRDWKKLKKFKQLIEQKLNQ